MFFYLLSASLSGTNLETIYIFSHEATAQFVSDYSENYNGFNATYTAFNASELTSKCSLCVCVWVCFFLFLFYPKSLVNLHFQFEKMEVEREVAFSGLSPIIRSTLKKIPYYFKDQVNYFCKAIHRFTGLCLAEGVMSDKTHLCK